MSFVVDFKLETILLAFYLICFIFFNFTTFLISDFYRKKFDNPLTNRGFLAAIVFLVITLFLLFIEDSQVISKLRLMLLVGSAILSSWNSTILYITMRKVRS